MRPKALVPLYQENNGTGVLQERSLRDNFEELCVGAELRRPDMEVENFCLHIHHSDPYKY